MPERRAREIEQSEREAARYLPPPSGHPRFPLLDPLRAVAAVMVLLVHVAILTGGFDSWYKAPLGHLDMGVPFFFLLSGFLLYRPMLASRVIELPAQRVRDYIRNRFFRIFPLYWFILIATAIVPGMYGAFSGDWWVYFGLLQNYPVYTPDGACANDLFRCANPPAWTLAMEVFFYAVLPFFAIAMAWITRRLGNWFRIELVVLALLAAISVVIQSSHSDADWFQWLVFSPLGRAWWFGLGMAMAVVSVRVQETGHTPSWVALIRDRGGWFWLAALALYMAGTYLFFDRGPMLAAPIGDTNQYIAQYLYFGVISALILAPAVFGSTASGVAQRTLAHPLLIRLGLISYGIFLWHYPAMIWLLEIGLLDHFPGLQFPALAIATLLLSILLSAATYLLLERPVMRWSRARSKRA